MLAGLYREHHIRIVQCLSDMGSKPDLAYLLRTQRAAGAGQQQQVMPVLCCCREQPSSDILVTGIAAGFHVIAVQLPHAGTQAKHNRGRRMTALRYCSCFHVISLCHTHRAT
jgi:hypothetical protein